MSTLLERSPAAPNLPAETAKPTPATAHPLALLATSTSLYIALLAGMASLNGVVEGYGWLYSIWFPLLLIHGVGGFIRGSRFPSWTAPFASALVIFAALWFHPSLHNRSFGTDRLERFEQLVADATLEFATQVPEVAFTPAVDFVFFILALSLALLIEILASARRLASLVVIPLAFAPVLASLFKLSGAGTGYVAIILTAMICYFSFLPYLWPGNEVPTLPNRRRLGMMGVLALVTTGTLVAASAWVPGFRQGMLPEGSRPAGELFASNLDPLLNLGRDLRSNNSATAFTYFTSAERAPYLRTHVISNLQAERWEPDPDPVTRSFAGTTAIREAYRSFAARSEYVEIDWADPPRDTQLPLPADSYLIEGVVGQWQWQPLTSIAQFTRDSRTSTAQVRVSYSELELDADIARNFAQFPQLSPEVDPSLSELPDDADQELSQALREHLQVLPELTDSGTGDFDRAVAIQDYLRSGQFRYSEQTPLREGYDGANLDVITAFLDRKAGYCVHFASTMAVMARASGIPSRVVIGYAPGERIEQTRSQPIEAVDALPGTAEAEQLELTGYRVSGQQAHAWPELYLPGLGWTAFEPTPGRGVPPEYAPAADSEMDEPIALDPLPETPEELVPSAPAPSDVPDDAPQNLAERSGAPASNGWWLLWLSVPLLMVTVTLPIIGRRTERQRRLARIASGGEGAAQAIWDELRVLGADFGLPHRPGQSETDYTTALSVVIADHAAELARLNECLMLSFYALRHPSADQGKQLCEDLQRIHAALRTRANLVQRIRAVLWPRRSSPGERVEREREAPTP